MLADVPVSRRGIIVASASLVVAMLVKSPHQAEGASDVMTVVESRKNSNYIKGHTFITDRGAGGMAYCAQGYLMQPTKGQKLNYWGNPNIPALDYALYHGYDGAVVRDVYGYTGDDAVWITGQAVWHAIGDNPNKVFFYPEQNGSQEHGNKYWKERLEQSPARAELKAAARRFIAECLAYKGGGIEDGCATLWTNPTIDPKSGLPWFQSLVTADKGGSAKLTKRASQPTFIHS